MAYVLRNRPQRVPLARMTPYCNTLACKSEVVHSFVKHDLRAFGANGLNVLVGKEATLYGIVCKWGTDHLGATV